MQKTNRRNLLKLLANSSLGVMALGSSAACAPASASTEEAADSGPLPEMRMHVGCQHGGTGKDNLEYLARHGVYHMDGGSPKFIEGVGWDLEDSLAKKEACEQYGIKLAAYHLPLSSAGIDRVSTPNIMLGKSPERDREIELIQQMIEVAAKSDVRLLLYNTTIHPVLRTGRTVDPKRGNVEYSTWNYEEAVKRNDPLTVAGDVDIDAMYERITYLLDRILPVAEEFKVKLGNHIADPPTPVGFRGITRWNSPEVFTGIKRFAELYDSEYHGFNLCLGSTAEGLKDPKTEILPIIKWVGERKQIFNIHLRNIIGGWNNFQEVYPDNGDMDFVAVIRALRAVGYDGMVMPDHIPRHADPASGLQGHAFAFGYIKALIQAIGQE
ncbi:mannonate dehydratase [Flavilitoribacter nigricans]|uniref:mannonate dehydratase n=1 Tax=Flavilitoribacter nigricans (strain ATCC 23147 / DSM 23189 / NBRC 102662 / NCIMB 1420 / SS-2) TaxID=1122177 RepID=A0A2D0N3B6_FLAN2|nr:mannonate dehydratase [Flavilitoribacter nigricans]PHN02995.1 mannonate dehydratase [Flavilitoribacter nigricans DSM 23189 = NBRC 102662]